MPKCKRLHNAGVSNIRFLSNLFWNAYERQHWSLVCAVLELLCASIMRQKPGFEGNHHIICMLQHAVYMRPRGLHDVPKQILCSLQSLVESPGIQAVLSFALSHLPVATQPSSTRPSGTSYEPLAQEELELNSLPRQSTAYSVDRRRATVLAALDNVYRALRGIQGEAKWQFATVGESASAPVTVAVCTGAGSWGVLGDSATCSTSSWLPSSYSDFQFLWEDCVRMLEEECSGTGSFEARLLLLHLQCISGRPLQPAAPPAACSLHHVECAKLDHIYELIAPPGSSQIDGSRHRQSSGRKRKRSGPLKRVDADQARKSLRPSRPAGGLLQGRHLCCAAVQELLQARSWTAVRLKSVLLHLDDAMLSYCAGGSTCISAVLAAAARCLHTQSVACRACIQQLQGQPSTSGGYQHSSADEGGQEEFVGWLEMVLLVRERRWWGLACDSAGGTLLQQSRSSACRLLGEHMTARDVLNAACLLAVMDPAFCALEADIAGGLTAMGLAVCSSEVELLMLQDVADCSRLVGPIV